MGTKKTIYKINETKSRFFEKVNQIDKALARLTKKKRERTQINKIRNERGDVGLIPQKHEGSSGSSMNNDMPTP